MKNNKCKLFGDKNETFNHIMNYFENNTRLGSTG